jgi:hypothetical protein
MTGKGESVRIAVTFRAFVHRGMGDLCVYAAQYFASQQMTLLRGKR